MSVGRRSILKMMGAGAVVLTAGGGAFLLTRTPASALAPWSAAARRHTDPRMRALSHAILAPNPHNRQPWIIDLRTEDELTLYCDLQRLLPETDPFGRQITIGLGCFLELLRMAAAEDGYRAEIEPFPDGVSRSMLGREPIARVRFHASDDARPDPLFAHVLERRSNKEPFDTSRTVPDAVLSQLAAAAGTKTAGAGIVVETTNDRRRVETFRELTWHAMRTEMITPRTYLESVRLMRIGKAEIEANPDGIDLGGPFLESLKLFGMLTRESLADPNSSAFQQGLDMYRGITGTAMAYLWLKTTGNSRISQLASGAAWLRTNLKAAELGIGIHPLSQALQEYAEMRPYFDDLHGMTGAGDGQRVQMLGRIGYGPDVPPSPRWPLESKIRKA